VVILAEFAVIFAVILVLGYIVPCARYYYWYYVRPNPEQKIQARQPTRDQIRREVELSVLSIFIFSVMATMLVEMYKLGWTSIYWRFRDWPLWYFPVSVFLCMVAHDTFFYWSHRFMHWQPVFKYFHAGHHKSISPTPWALYAFQPAEAALQFVGIWLIVIFIPLHPLALLLFFWHDGEVNAAGHTGYEVVPKWVSGHWLYRGFNTVRHHDAHHTNMRVNYGSFFNVWDRWMGTFYDAKAEEAAAEATPQGTELEGPHTAKKPQRSRTAAPSRSKLVSDA
jgi:sterol desaturase/sphingolipid hydroxylase (fatty acid hydroxylase superfamily)